MFENLSIGHLAVVLLIVLLLFGAKRIPEIAGSLGNGIREFKKSVTETTGAGGPLDTFGTRDANDGRSFGGPTGASGVGRADTELDREPKRLMR